MAIVPGGSGCGFGFALNFSFNKAVWVEGGGCEIALFHAQFHRLRSAKVQILGDLLFGRDPGTLRLGGRRCFRPRAVDLFTQTRGRVEFLLGGCFPIKYTEEQRVSGGRSTTGGIKHAVCEYHWKERQRETARESKRRRGGVGGQACSRMHMAWVCVCVCVCACACACVYAMQQSVAC